MTTVLPCGQTAEARGEGFSCASPVNHDAAIVIGLTAIAGIARLATAAAPGLWNDEAQTFRRVCGTFAELTAMLREAPFPPLHYFLYWLLGRALGGAGHLTPFWMRFIPALAGTLMVPAMWRLARQFCDRRTALMVAALTAVSAFLFAYSHDAKMYMPLWLLVTVNFSLWISFLREQKGRHWIGWVVSGIAMVGYHASGMAMLAVELAAFAAAGQFGRRKLLLALGGLLLIVSGPAAYYGLSNNLVSQSRQVGWHTASGLGWVPNYDSGRNPVLEMGGTFFVGWGGPGEHLNGWMRAGLGGVCWVAIVATVAGGAFWFARRDRSGVRAPPIRVEDAFTICFWLAGPVLAALALSQPGGSNGSFRPAAILCFIVAGLLLLWSGWRQFRPILEGIFGVSQVNAIPAIVLALAIGCAIALVVEGIAAGSPHSSSVWVPRYIGFIWPALAIVVCAAICQLPAPLRWGAAALLLGANVAQSAALVLVKSEPPIDCIASDAQRARQSGEKVRNYVYAEAPSSDGCAGGAIINSVGRYYLSLETGDRFGPRGFEDVPLGDFADVRLWSTAQDILSDLKQSEMPERLIVWDSVPLEGPPALTESALWPDWRIVSERRIPVRNHWNWNTLFSYRRLELVRNR